MQHDVIPDAPALRVRDGLQLHWRDWPLSSPRGAILMVHGLGEHIGRYDHVAQQLNSWGWAVSGYDHRGHGRSPGQRGGLVRDDDLLHDLAFAIDRMRARYPRLPLILLGHSMGGIAVARFAAGLSEPRSSQPAWARPIDGIVLSSPALDPGLNPFQKFLLKTAGNALPDFGNSNGIRVEDICNDADVVAAYKADPLVHGTITGRLGRFIVDAGIQVQKRAAHWKVPTLLVYASNERVLNPKGSERFAQTASPALVKSHAFPNFGHEILNERERDEVFAVMRPWLDARVSATAHTGTASAA